MKRKEYKLKLRKYVFGDKVHDWLEYNKRYIILKKTRGHYYYIIDKKGTIYKLYHFRLNKGWKKK